MDEVSASWESITSLWSDKSLEGLTCYHCGKSISKESEFTRTFTVSATGEKPKGVRVSVFSDRIELFYRHLECLLNSTCYVVVSHVWEQHVAELQYKRREAYPLATRAYAVLRDIPMRIFECLQAELSEPFEIWHDYISVPQWADDVKHRALPHIPDIFHRAQLTAVYFADVDKGSFNAMRAGESNVEICRALGRICSASWFSRIWTAIELTHSPQVRVVAQDLSLVPRDTEDDPIMHEITRRWQDEVSKIGVAKKVEDIVWQDGNHFVPWQLGPLAIVRSCNLEGKIPCFGIALSLLNRRRVTIHRDFLHALEGLLRTHIPIPPDAEIKDTLLRLAHSCLSTGDLSPLLVKPASAPSGLGSMELGYIDHAIWGLGRQQEPAEFPTVKQLQCKDSFVVQAEEIGIFKLARLLDWDSESEESMLRKLCQMAIEVTGSDVDRFMETVGARLYGQTPETLKKRLDGENRRSRLVAEVQKLCDDPAKFEDFEVLESIAGIMGLSNMSLGDDRDERMTPMTYLKHHAITLHHNKLGAVVHITCTQCHIVHLLRIALFKPADSLKDSRAYRLPGLKYHHTHAGGAGVLLQGRRIVGRFVWGYPTCSCPRPVGVEVTVDDFPTTMPGMHK